MRRARWAVAPLGWRDAGPLRPRVRAAARRGVEMARTRPEPVPVASGPPAGWLAGSDGANRRPLYLATHPTTGDELVTHGRTRPPTWDTVPRRCSAVWASTLITAGDASCPARSTFHGRHDSGAGSALMTDHSEKPDLQQIDDAMAACARPSRGSSASNAQSICDRARRLRAFADDLPEQLPGRAAAPSCWRGPKSSSRGSRDPSGSAATS